MNGSTVASILRYFESALEDCILSTGAVFISTSPNLERLLMGKKHVPEGEIQGLLSIHKSMHIEPVRSNRFQN